MSVLRIQILEARALRDSDFFGKMDPYVVLEMDPYDFKTKTHKNGGKKPVWNQQFELVVDASSPNLSLTIWDNDRMRRDSKIAHTEIPVAQLFNVDTWFDLKPTGQIHIKSDAGPPVQSFLSRAITPGGTKRALLVGCNYPGSLGWLEGPKIFFFGDLFFDF
eukprot:TRINITY_DN1364_c0_g1_i2.p1 TRINITY_DN1364_c0_g1~~TRINITY_DN1364_c0_g1_i2.p1  ORF type:complete len:169 (+),score=45.93 TRINITY_DN1364_c0_g1_i2:24-509(+)